MTVVLDTDGPGTETYRSSIFEVEVASVSAYVYSRTRTTQFGVTGFWANNESVELSCVTLTSDETSIVVSVLPVTGTITTYAIIDDIGNNARTVEDGATLASDGSELTFTMPASSNVEVYINDDLANSLTISHNTLEPAMPAGDDFSGAETSVAEDAVLRFLAGSVHTIPESTINGRQMRRLTMNAGSTVHIEHGAVVYGQIAYPGVSNITVQGYGLLDGSWATNETVDAIGDVFLEQVEYSQLMGLDPLYPPVSGNSVSGVTVINPSWYCTAYGASYYENVKLIGPWCDNVNGFTYYPDLATTGSPAGITNCVAIVGDDCLTLESGDAAVTVSGGLFATAGSAVIHLSYQSPAGITDLENTVDCTIIAMCGYADNGDGREGGHICRAWVDSTKANPTYGRAHFDITFRVFDPGAGINAMPFSFKNNIYPWGTSYDATGQIYDINLHDIYFETEPDQASELEGLDAISTPHDITFEDVWFGDVQLSHRNFAEYFDTNDYIYGISVEGKTLVTAVDICNTALSHLGAAAKVTSISPVDGSAEARHCARFYPMARDTVLSLHDWNFARTRAALASVTIDNDAWDYAYTIPADMLKAIAVMHEDSTDDYTISLALPDGTTATPMGASNQVIPQQFVIEQNTSDVLVIMTDMEDAWLRYTKYITDTNQFPPLFVQAVSYMLAAQLAGVLIKGKEGAEEHRKCTQLAMAYLSQARVIDSQQRKVNTSRSPSWISAR